MECVMFFDNLASLTEGDNTLNRDEDRAFFAPRTNETKEGRKAIALYWAIDGFLDWLPDTRQDADALIQVLYTIVKATREIADTPEYRAYLNSPMPDDNTGRFSSNRAVRESMTQSFSHRKECAKPINIPKIVVKL
jgi:hypothetical protein